LEATYTIGHPNSRTCNFDWQLFDGANDLYWVDDGANDG
jgi:hypothetical protein